LREKGVPSLRNKAVRGDHYVTLVVQVPTNLNSEQKELLKKFDDAMLGKTERVAEGTENEKGKKKFWK
jgi:molecular chaperone DnaJ